MQYDSQAQKNLVMNALIKYAVPLGERTVVDPLVTQLSNGKIVEEKPAEPAPKKDPVTGPKRKKKK